MSRVVLSKVSTVLGKYKRLRFECQFNEKTGKNEIMIYNYRNKNILNFVGNQSSIVVGGKIYRVDQAYKKDLLGKIFSWKGTFISVQR